MTYNRCTRQKLIQLLSPNIKLSRQDLTILDCIAALHNQPNNSKIATTIQMNFFQKLEDQK